MTFFSNPNNTIDDDRDPWEIMNDTPESDELSSAAMHELGDEEDELAEKPPKKGTGDLDEAELEALEAGDADLNDLAKDEEET